MKKNLLMLLISLLTVSAFSACSEDENTDTSNEGDAPTLSVSQTDIPAASTAGSYAVAVASNGAWTAAVDAAAAEWCSVTPTSGSGNDTVTVTVTANSALQERTATITFALDTLSRTVTLTQAAFVPVLSVDKATINAADVVGNYAVVVTSNVAWTAAVDATAAEWCTVTPTSGSGNGTVTVAVTANAASNQRAATITFTAGALSRTVTLTQAAFVPVLSVDKATINAADVDSSYAVAVTSNVAWTAAVDAAAAEWCTVTPTSGSGNDTVTVAVTANAASNHRTATITFTAGALSPTVTLTQQEKAIPAPPHAASAKQWTIQNADGSVRQTWSDHINIPGCNKEDFSSGEHPFTSPRADCRNNPNGYFLYSGAYVAQNAATLCPEGWRIPTKDDFDKVIAICNISAYGFMYNTADGGFGGTLGGYCDHTGKLDGLSPSKSGSYWSVTDDDDSGISAYYLSFSEGGSKNLEAHYKIMGFGVRCVR
jgi:uncharacterized protein (TIGR02145 family)